MQKTLSASSAETAQTNRIAVLVLGMHRSGTSAVAGVLDLLGVPVPGELLPPAADNEKGFFENKAVCEFHERLLAHLGSSWDDPMPLSSDFVDTPYGAGFVAELAQIIQAEFLNTWSIFAVKDPRMSRFIPVWQAALERLGTSARAVIPLRHPADVAGSLGKRNAFPRAKTFLIWLDHMLAIEHETRAMPRSIVSYDALLDDWRGVTDRLSRELDLTWPKERARVEHAVDAFISRDMRHHRQATEIGDATRLDALVARSWDTFLAFAQNPDDVQARETLDGIRTELHSAASVISPYLSWEHADRRKTDKAKDQIIVTLNSAVAELREIERTLSGELGKARDAHQRDRAALEISLQNEIRELRQEKEDAAALLKIIDQLEEDAVRQQQEADHYRTSLHAILSSTSWRALKPVHKAVESLPVSFKTMLRQGARAGWWIVTPWKTGERLRYLQTRDSQHLLLQNGGTSLTGLASGAFVPFKMRTYDAWVRRYDTLKDHDRAAIRAKSNALGYKPLISIVMPTYNTPAAVLRDAIASVQAQLYENWELCIADDASPAEHVTKLLAELASTDLRIKWTRRETNGHIAAASNTALELAQGEFVALMDHDDLLPEHALYEIARLLNERPDADIIYSDEDKVDETGKRSDPYFKPDFSYDLFLGQNVINHLGIYRTALLRQVEGFRSGVDGSQDYDLALRCIAETTPDKILHVPKVLYHWRQPSGAVSFSQSALDKCIAASRKAIQDHLDAAYADQPLKPTVEACPTVPSWNRVRWPIPDPAPLVSVIIPTRDYAQLMKQCVDGLLRRTDYKNIEIIVVDNGSVEQRTRDLFASWKTEPRIRVLPDPGPFNYSRLNNLAAAEAKGDLLLLLNNDIDVIEPGWLTEMVSLALRPGVGAVGAKLLYADKRVQHAGVRLGAGTFDDGPGVAGHFGHLVPSHDSGYFGSYALTRDVSAVTAACLLTPRAVFEKVGGLDETNLAVAFNDIDLCLRIVEAGYRVLWTPYAELFHLESASRGTDMSPEKRDRFGREARFMRARWRALLDHDPFYNPAFDNTAPDFTLNFASVDR